MAPGHVDMDGMKSGEVTEPVNFLGVTIAYRKRCEIIGTVRYLSDGVDEPLHLKDSWTYHFFVSGAYWDIRKQLKDAPRSLEAKL